MNLLKETLSKLEKNGKSKNDVLWVGCSDFKTTWENFEAISNTEYDSGYGAPEVAEDLIVMGKDFWLERHEYDGSEWWEFKSKDILEPTEMRAIDAVTIGQATKLGRGVSCGWESLASINGITKQPT